jgi:hypothetical protein
VLLSGPLADIYKRKRLAYFAIGATTLISYPFAIAIVGRHVVLVGTRVLKKTGNLKLVIRPWDRRTLERR